MALLAGSAAAQSKLTAAEWSAFKQSAKSYDSLQTVFQKMVEADPELQKNPSLLQSRLGDDLGKINGIYQGLTANAEPAPNKLDSDFSVYLPEDLRTIKMAAIASRNINLAIKADEKLAGFIVDRDSALALKMELAKFHAYLKNYDEAAAYATADVLGGASDQDKLQFYPMISKGYADKGNLDKAMLYAFKAMETLKTYRDAIAMQLKGTEDEERQIAMMEQFIVQQYTEVIYNVAYTAGKDEKVRDSFIEEAKAVVNDEAMWNKVNTTLSQRMSAQKMKDARLNQPAPKWDEHDWVNGDALALDKLKGKVVLVDFFATWCKPCIMAFPHIRDWQKKYAEKGLVVAGLTSYQGRYKGREVKPSEEMDKMKNEFIKENDITWTVGIEKEGQDTFESYGVQGIPFVVLIDKAGNVRYTKTGAADYEETESMIQKLLEEKD